MLHHMYKFEKSCLFSGTTQDQQNTRAQTRDRKKKKMSDEEIHSRLRNVFCVSFTLLQNNNIHQLYIKIAGMVVGFKWCPKMLFEGFVCAVILTSLCCNFGLQFTRIL